MNNKNEPDACPVVAQQGVLLFPVKGAAVTFGKKLCNQ